MASNQCLSDTEVKCCLKCSYNNGGSVGLDEVIISGVATLANAEGLKREQEECVQLK